MDEFTIGRSTDHVLCTCSRNIWSLTAVFIISVTGTRIQGFNNNKSTADPLSRWYVIAGDSVCR